MWPSFSSVAGNVHGKLQSAPYAQFIESAAQMVLDHLLAGTHDLAYFAVG
jgi:hypothetical protein